MKSALIKQGLIVNEEVKGVEIESNEQKPAEPMVKFYGKEALPAVKDWIWNDMTIYCFVFFLVCLFYFIFYPFDDLGHGENKVTIS